MLGAEAQYLPESVAIEVKLFFEGLTDWTRTALDPDHTHSDSVEMAAHIISSMQGAMVLSVATGNFGHLSTSEKMLKKLIAGSGF